MPNLELEKALRQAIVKIQDETSFSHACGLIDNPEIDINSAGPISGKTAFNFAVEALFVPLLKMQDTSKQLVDLRLRIIVKLLMSQANTEVMQHSYTKNLFKEITKTTLNIYNNINARISSLTRPEDFHPDSFLANLTTQQKLFISSFYMFNAILSMSELLIKLETEHSMVMATNGYKKLANKIIMLMENHDDDGTYLFINKHLSQLNKSKYALCLELPFNSKDYYAADYKIHFSASKLLQLALSPQIAGDIIFIDPSYDCMHEDKIRFILDVFSKIYFSPEVTRQMRDRGMFLFICQAALKHDGKIIAIVGANHSMILSYLEAQNIAFASASTFVDPTLLDLIKQEDGTFITRPDADPSMELLFRKFPIQALQLDAGQEKANVALDSFVKSNLSFNLT